MIHQDDIHSLLDEEYFESVESYTPRKDFSSIADKLIPETWSRVRRSVWFTCLPPVTSMPRQGWKIHVSGSMGHSKEILARTIAVLCDQSVPFKFCLDLFILSLVNSKGWARGGSGKFITVYPHSIEQFRLLASDLDHATRGLSGPHILSDKRYRNSRCVYYRYGEMNSDAGVDVFGESISELVAPGGTREPDARNAYYRKPEWEGRPFDEPSEVSRIDLALNGGRYSVLKALKFSSAGGVYLAKDNSSGDRVVIKEARPHIVVGAGERAMDATLVLRLEYEHLIRIQDLGVAPRPIEMFQSWEHHFLVEEFIDGVSLVELAARNPVLLSSRPSRNSIAQFYGEFAVAFKGIVAKMAQIHDRGLLLNDLSPNNVLVSPDSLDIHFVDFEAASLEGSEAPVVAIITPGFTDPGRMHRAVGVRDDDYYALGAMMISHLTGIFSIGQLCRKALEGFLALFVRQFGLPPEFGRLSLSLVGDPRDRPNAAQIISVLNGLHLPNKSAHREIHEQTSISWSEWAKAIAEDIVYRADYARRDRLFPADVKVFQTNPLSIAYGACGIALILNRVLGRVPQRICEWIDMQELSNERYPPGLYLGLSGIGWALLELGMSAKAEHAFALAIDNPQRMTCPDIFYGYAGTGIAALKFFLSTRNDRYLKKAVEIADAISVRYMGTSPAEIGLAHGSSGIALFFAYLYCVTKDDLHLETGRRFLDRELGRCAIDLDGTVSLSGGNTQRRKSFTSLQHGGAGIGSVVARFFAITGDLTYRHAMERLFIDADRSTGTNHGMLAGLAGLATFSLDLYQITSNISYLHSAERLGRTIALFAIEKEGRMSFPGYGLLKLSCDFGTGSAGICSLFYRLATRARNVLMLDELIPLSSPGISESERVIQS